MERIRTLAPHAARVLLGLVFFVFGLNGFLGFLPTPPHGAEADAFLGALAATGYMFPLIKGTEVVAGALLLGNRLVPLALVLLAPVVVNIVLFHAVLDPAGLVVPIVVLGLELALAWTYRDSFRSLFVASALKTPATSRERARGLATVSARPCELDRVSSTV